MIESVVSFISIWVIEIIKILGYPGIFILMALESANIPIPSEVIMPFSGFLAFTGNFSFFWVVVVGALGNLFGSIVSYFIAVWVVNNRSKSKIIGFFIHEEFLERANKWFLKYGSYSIFFSRMLPVVRTFISLPAGIGKMKLLRFSLLTFLGSLIWSTFLAYIGFFLGERWDTLGGYFRRFDIAIVAVILIGIAFWLRRRFNGKIKNKISL